MITLLPDVQNAVIGHIRTFVVTLVQYIYDDNEQTDDDNDDNANEEEGSPT